MQLGRAISGQIGRIARRAPHTRPRYKHVLRAGADSTHALGVGVAFGVGAPARQRLARTEERRDVLA